MIVCAITALFLNLCLTWKTFGRKKEINKEESIQTQNRILCHNKEADEWQSVNIFLCSGRLVLCTQ